MRKVLVLWTNGFVVWVALFAVAAYFVPRPFAALQPAIAPGLGLIMFGMGITLTSADFQRVLRMPRAVACGILGQFLIMPLVAALLAWVFRLPPDIAMGFIIVGSCPGGTASNVVSYLAKADVALSVTMTSCTTLMAVVLTPALIGLYGGVYLPVDRWGLFMSLVQIVLVPVALGFGVRWWLREKTRAVLEVFPAISVLVVALVIACVTALSRDNIVNNLSVTGLLVVVHNISGLALGYALATMFRLPVTARRTIAIEVGMQNSGLGVALAKAHFDSALTALPASLFSVVHNMTGSAIAGYWARRPIKGESASINS
ncbi:MAG: Na+-dependent transporter [Candidatus Hydrogenedentota bacterium]